MKKFQYGVQWIDDGGPFDHPTTQEDLIEPFSKMNLNAETDILKNYAVILKNGEAHYMIETRIEVPFWPIASPVSCYAERYSTGPDLWLYTFSVTENDIEKTIPLEEWDEINQF